VYGCCWTSSETFVSLFLARINFISMICCPISTREYALLNLHSAGSLQQQSAGWYVATLEHFVLIANQPAFCPFPLLRDQPSEMKFILAKNKLTNVSLGVQQQPYTHSSRDFASYFEKCKIPKNNTHVGGKIIAIHVHHIRSNKLNISAH
jgi:hypothetical protein